MGKLSWLLQGGGSSTGIRKGDGALTTVPYVDLQRYLGRWYEIARYPNRFENSRDRDITATYSLMSDGRIRVVNTCVHHDGRVEDIRGWARVSDPRTNARLRVTFFWPFFGNYWILDLGSDYDYSVVGEPKHKFLWILSRSPWMSPEQYQSILSRLPSQGYDPERLILARQSWQ